MPINTKIQIRKGTSSEWSSINPVLGLGEPGFDTTNNILKVGNGSTAWNSLSGINITGSGTTNYVAKFTDADTIGNGIIFDNGTNVGIGTTTPSGKLHVIGSGIFSGGIITSTGNFTTSISSSLLNIDNIRIDQNTISSTNSNGNIIINPNGNGALQRDGNDDARGQYAIDWQSVRDYATEVAAGNYSVIGGGKKNKTANNGSVVGGGYYNSALANGSVICGGGWLHPVANVIQGNSINSESPISTICGGAGNNISNYEACIIGGGYNNTISGGSYITISGGKYNSITGVGTNGSFIGGGNNNDITGSMNDHAVIVGGINNTISSYSAYAVFIGGGYNNNISGTSNHYNVIVGGKNNTISCTYGADLFIGGGSSNSISGYSNHKGVVVGGYNNTISGYNSSHCSILGGRANDILGTSSHYSSICGGRTNIIGDNAQYSCIIGGYEAKTTRYGEISHSAGKFANFGDSQHTTLIARRLTTNNTANQVLFLDGAANRLIIPAKTTWTFEIKLSAYNDTDNQGGWWIFRGGIRRNAANSTSLIGSVITEFGTESSLSTASASVVADDTNEALEIRVTGVASKNIRWVAVVNISQVSYGAP